MATSDKSRVASGSGASVALRATTSRRATSLSISTGVRGGELDLVMMRGDEIVFARSRLEAAGGSARASRRSTNASNASCVAPPCHGSTPTVDMVVSDSMSPRSPVHASRSSKRRSERAATVRRCALTPLLLRARLAGLAAVPAASVPVRRRSELPWARSRSGRCPVRCHGCSSDTRTTCSPGTAAGTGRLAPRRPLDRPSRLPKKTHASKRTPAMIVAPTNT